MRSSKSEVAFSILSVIAVCLFPVVFLYTQNAAEAMVSECLRPAAIFCGSGLVLLLVLSLCLKNVLFAGVIADAVMLVMLNFALLEKGMLLICKELRYWQCLGILAILLVHIGVAIYKKFSKEICRYTVQIVAGVFGFLILINSVMAIPTILNKVSASKELKEKKNKMTAQEIDHSRSLPNIYYFICDEYSGFETSKNILGYDNEAFAKFLEDRGFFVSRNSYNEDANTRVVTCDLMDLSYWAVEHLDDPIGIEAKRKENKLFNLLRENGYHIQSVGEGAEFFGLEGVAEEASSSKTGKGESFEDLLINSTAFYPFVTKNNSARQKQILANFERVNDPDYFGESNTASLIYMEFPHEPFLFDENGNSTSTQNYTNWKDLKYYLGQMKFCTKLLQESVDKIIKRDPNCIIILQSDHAARASTDSTLVRKLIPYENMKNCLNAVYYCGEDISEISGQSAMNTLRLILNRLLDCKFEIVEVP